MYFALKAYFSSLIITNKGPVCFPFDWISAIIGLLFGLDIWVFPRFAVVGERNTYARS